MKKFSLFLFSVVIPATIIYLSIDTWGENIALNLITQLNNYFGSFSIDIAYGNGQIVNITKPDPTISWTLLLSLFIGYVLVHKKLVKPYIKESIKKMDFEQRKRSILILGDEVIGKIVNWIVIYAILDNLGASYPTNYFFQNGLNWIMISIFIGEALRISETFKHIRLYFKK